MVKNALKMVLSLQKVELRASIFTKHLVFSSGMILDNIYTFLKFLKKMVKINIFFITKNGQNALKMVDF